jgi:hypothetical protein
MALHVTVIASVSVLVGLVDFTTAAPVMLMPAPRFFSCPSRVRKSRAAIPQAGRLALTLIHHVSRSFPVPAYFYECSANSPSNHAASENPFLKLIFAPAEESKESCAGAGPNTVKPDPGSDWNVATMLGSDQLSCAQAAQVRSVKLAP